MKTLDEALLYLAQAFTRDDDLSGFTVEHTPAPHIHGDDASYIEAWRIVRQHLHLQTNPTREYGN